MRMANYSPPAMVQPRQARSQAPSRPTKMYVFILLADSANKLSRCSYLSTKNTDQRIKGVDVVSITTSQTGRHTAPLLLTEFQFLEHGFTKWYIAPCFEKVTKACRYRKAKEVWLAYWRHRDPTVDHFGVFAECNRMGAYRV